MAKSFKSPPPSVGSAEIKRTQIQKKQESILQASMNRNQMIEEAKKRALKKEKSSQIDMVDKLHSPYVLMAERIKEEEKQAKIKKTRVAAKIKGLRNKLEEKRKAPLKTLAEKEKSILQKAAIELAGTPSEFTGIITDPKTGKKKTVSTNSVAELYATYGHQNLKLTGFKLATDSNGSLGVNADTLKNDDVKIIEEEIEVPPSRGSGCTLPKNSNPKILQQQPKGTS